MARTKAERFTAQQVADALTAGHGFVSVAAKSLSTTDQTIRDYMKRYAVVKQACEDAREKMIDYAEGALYKQIQEGNITAIIFFLKTQGRKRGNGYSERTEIVTPEGEALRVVLDR